MDLRALPLACLVLGALHSDAAAQSDTARPRLVINEVMANPSAVLDERGEWFELHNRERRPVDLRGYRIASGNDAGHVVARSLVVPGGGYVVLARDASTRGNGGVTAGYVYGASISLANGHDWLVVRDPSGMTVDSVVWRSTSRGVAWALRAPETEHVGVGGAHWQLATTMYGKGDRGTPGRQNDGYVASRRALDVGERGIVRADSVGGTTDDPDAVSELVVRVLDVGQGDAILVANGGSRLLIDGGPEPGRLGQLLDSLGLNEGTIDVVVLSHQHADHHSGLRELFRTSRRIRVRFFFENQDAHPSIALAELRDSVGARVARGELVYRDTDDPCADGRPVCTITMRGGARLHVMRPLPRAAIANDRSAPLKLVGPDSASFTMWLAGDAEHGALRWFDTGADYDTRPGMRATVLKANHHGSCNGVSARYLRLTSPDWVVMSVAAPNEYGHVHDQAKAVYRRARTPWYRTDENGTITIRSPGTAGGGYSIQVSRGRPWADGRSDRRSAQANCSPVP